MTDNKHHIIVYRANNSRGKKDATGAFEPEAHALARLLSEHYPGSHVEIAGINIAVDRGLKRLQKAEIINKVARETVKECLYKIQTKAGEKVKLDSLSYFCHGWRTGCELELLGPSGARNCALWLSSPSLRVKRFNLFACSTGKPHPEGNFAQWVTDQCAQRRHKIQVMAHETPGHTSWNARLRFYWSVPPTGGPSEIEENNFSVEWASATDRDKHQLLEAPEKFKDFARHMREDQDYRLLLPYLIGE